MVTTNWREMEAGRELDKEIARRVIGVPVTFDDYGGDEGILIYRDGIDDRHGICYDELAHYSTDLNAAFALTRIEPCDFNMNIRAVGGWHVNFSDATKSNAGAWGEGLVDDDQPALAICRAFLAWKEAQS